MFRGCKQLSRIVLSRNKIRITSFYCVHYCVAQKRHGALRDKYLSFCVFFVRHSFACFPLAGLASFGFLHPAAKKETQK